MRSSESFFSWLEFTLVGADHFLQFEGHPESAGNHVGDQAYQFADPKGSPALGKGQRQDLISISNQPDDLAKDTCDYDSRIGNHEIPTQRSALADRTSSQGRVHGITGTRSKATSHLRLIGSLATTRNCSTILSSNIGTSARPHQSRLSAPSSLPAPAQ